MERGVVVAVGFKVEGDANEWLTSIKGRQSHWWARPWSTSRSSARSKSAARLTSARGINIPGHAFNSSI